MAQTNIDAVLFPTDMEVQAIGGPMASTSITTSVGGLEPRKANYLRLPRQYKVSFGPESSPVILGLFDCQLGGRFGFMLHDPNDYTVTCITLAKTTVAGKTVCQLITQKQTLNYFTSAVVRTYTRPETLPDINNCQIFENAVLQVAGVDYNLGDQDGTVNFTRLVSGTASATFNYFVGVRFADEALNLNFLSTQADGSVLLSISQISLLEVLPGAPA